MKRVVKKPDIRRLEIMTEAQKLFEKEGYTKTSVESIIKKTGVAKGTFYYYFKSKDEILQALVDRTTIDLEGHFKSILMSDDLTAIEKLKLMIRGPNKKKITSSAVMKIIHKPENRELQEKLNIQAIKIIAPLISQVLIEGKQKGNFLEAPSLEIVQLVLAGSQFVLDSGLFNWTSKQRSVFLKELQLLFELLTRTPSGTFKFMRS